MTDYDWAQIRITTIEAFGGDAPGNILEQRIIDAFLAEPQRVLNQIGVVTTKYAAGKIDSPWAILDLNIRNANNPAARAVAHDTTEKKKRILRAESWLHNAGMHFDSESEIQDELFGDRGILHAYHADQALVDQILERYREERREGEQIEADAIKRAEDWKAAQARVVALTAAKAEAALAAIEGDYERPPPDETLAPEEPE